MGARLARAAEQRVRRRGELPAGSDRCFNEENEMGKQDVAKVIEVVGSSSKSWTEAADKAVRTASKTVKNITGVQVLHMTGQVKGGKIATYKTTVKVAFGIEG